MTFWRSKLPSVFVWSRTTAVKEPGSSNPAGTRSTVAPTDGTPLSDATPVTVEALDARARPVPTANLPVSFEIAGGRIIGLGNGDANSHEPEKGDARRLYNGLAQVIVQTEEGGAGTLVLRATAAGLKPAEARIAVRADRGPPSVPHG